ncbi:YveK family protein [Fictibacillus fluitans]|uniref:Wzz/FepE/Etk N-terminal domain-containing protein n=1 Tax=Fictibacillus fluitans TaxID=3058422 RepID=A0ABT8I124_9BACL|nr:Wzz/FepE/Etk N-terminal domain-containing protein [Fictibacillus sp. NE201]MDN4526738.1 Wzz/FepE/Etk N-terminal domain-containing protein [Fictibacillus sp. NE201]
MDGERAKEINIKELFNVMRRQLWIIAAVTILFTLCGSLYATYYTTPLYQSSTRIIIGANQDNMKTLQVIIRDVTVLQKVVDQLDLHITPESLAGKINVESVDESQVVSINVTDTNAEMAARIANTTATVFKKEIPDILSFKDVRYLSPAKVNPYPINENDTRTMTISFIIGLMAGIGLAFLRDSLDDTIRGSRELDDLGITLLGSVPKIDQRKLQKNEKPYEVRSESVDVK